jgi:hypothetical protein
VTDQDRTPWWELDPEESPVPLDTDGWVAADDAELIVNLEREAIIREDTEPTLSTLATLNALGERHESRGLRVSHLSLMTAALSLLLGCAAMFVLGWSQGSAPGAASQQDSVEKSALQSKRDVTSITRYPPHSSGSLKDSMVESFRKGDGR